MHELQAASHFPDLKVPQEMARVIEAFVNGLTGRKV
jgi:hypothetical protein